MDFKRAIQVAIRALVLLFICGLLPGLSLGAMPGDIDGDGQVCMTDYRLLIAARNQPADGPDDPRDIDGDGTITVLDARKLILLCDLPRCVCVTLPQNETPIANAGPDQEHTLAYGQTALEITLDGSASDDPDGTVSTYTWAGSPDPTDEMQPTLTLGEGTYAFALTVTDNDGAESTPDTVQIIINPPENQRPVADAGENRTLTLSPGFQSLTVTLDGRDSYDPDGHALSYEWSGDPDPDDVELPQLTLSPGTYTFSLVVIDEPGLASAPAEVTISVEAQDTGGPPQLTAEPSQFTVTEGDTLEFGVSAIDPDGDSVTLSASPKIEHATFTASPGVDASGIFTFSPDFTQQGIYVVVLKARDALGNTATKTVTITVDNVNRAPVLTVGDAFEVDEGQMLTVMVSAFDPDGDTVALSTGELPENAIFIAATGTLAFTPDYDQAGSYLIPFTASDGDLSDNENMGIAVGDVTGGGGSGKLELTVDPVESPTLFSTVRITGTVNADGAGLLPRITSALITGVNGTSGRQGETLDVVLTGQSTGDFETHFASGISTADFGDGVTVNSTRVDSPSQVKANITIDSDAAIGVRGVTVDTGNETALAVPAFRVTAGRVTISGTLTDPDTGVHISGAIVSIEGTTITTTTNADGAFYFTDVPAGCYTVIVNAADHELIRVAVDSAVGDEINLGTLKSDTTVFSADVTPGATLPSIYSRGLTKLQFTGDLDDARQLIEDTLLAVGDSRYGILDVYGNQLNPNVSENGIASLKEVAAYDMATRWQQGHTVSLGNMLYSFIKLFEWENDAPPSFYGLLAAIQSVVDDAWENPGAPENALPIAMFATGNALVPGDPPTLSPETRLNPLQSYLISVTLLGYVAEQIEEGTTGALSVDRPVLAALGHLFDLLGPATAYADDDNTLFSWQTVFDQASGTLTGEIKSFAEDTVTGFAEDFLGVVTPSMTFSTESRSTAVGMWVDFMNTLPQGSHVSSVTTDLVNNPEDLLNAFEETREAAESVAELAEHTTKAAEIVTDALSGVVGKVADTVLTKLMMEPIVNAIVETSRPSAPYLDGAVAVDSETGLLPSVRVTFRPCYEEVNSSFHKDSDYRYYYAIYRQSTVDPHELLTVMPSYRFYEEFADKDPIVGRTRFKYRLTQVGRNAKLVFTDPKPPAGANVYRVVTRVMRGTTVANTTYTPLEAEMALDFLIGRAGPGVSITWKLFTSTMDTMLNIFQSTLYQVSDFSSAARVHVGTPVENLFPRMDLATADFTGEVFVSIPDINSILKWTPSGLKLKASAGFATPHQIGLASDIWGNLYADNGASDILYGGRIFRFSALDGARALVGTVNYFSRLLMYANSVDIRAMTYGIEGNTEYLYIADGIVPRITRLDLRDGSIITSSNDRNVCHDDIYSAPGAAFNFQSNSRLYHDDTTETLYLTQGPELLYIRAGEVKKAFEESFDPFTGAWLTGVHCSRSDNIVLADMLSGDVFMVPTVFFGSAGFGLDAGEFRKLYRVATGLSAPLDLKVKYGSRQFYVLDSLGVHHLHFGLSGRIWDEQNAAPLNGATLLIDGMVSGQTDTEGYFTLNNVSDTGPIEVSVQASDGRCEILADAKQIYVEAVGPTVLHNDIIFDPPPVPDPLDLDEDYLSTGDLVIDPAADPVETEIAVDADDLGTSIVQHFIVPAARVAVSDDLAADLGVAAASDRVLAPRTLTSLTENDVPLLPGRSGDSAGGRSKKTYTMAVRLLSHPDGLKRASRADGSPYESRRSLKGVLLVPEDYPEATPSRVSVRINGTVRQADVVNGIFELAEADMAAIDGGLNIISATAAASEVDRDDGFLPPVTRASRTPVGIYGHRLSNAPEPASDWSGDTADEAKAAVSSWETEAEAATAPNLEGIAFTGLVAARAAEDERPLALPGMQVIVYQADVPATTAAEARETALASGTTDRAGYYEVIVPADVLAAPAMQADPFNTDSVPSRTLRVMVAPRAAARAAE